MVVLPISAAFFFTLKVDDKNGKETAVISVRICGILTMVVYGIFRLCIIVEMFYSLHSSPKDIYKDVQWSQFLPHL